MMNNTHNRARCWILTTAIFALAVGCNSDEIRQDSQSGGQSSATDSTAGTDAATATTPTEASATASMSDSDAGSGSGSQSDSVASNSASATDSASEATASATEAASATMTATATDTDGTASDSNSNSNSNSATDTDGTAGDTDGTAGDTDGTAGDTDTDTGTASDTDTGGDMCGPGLSNDNACEGCLIDNCCDAYDACSGDEDCLCLLTHCSDADVPATCALLKCKVSLIALPVTLNYLLECLPSCGVLCPVLDIL